MKPAIIIPIQNNVDDIAILIMRILKLKIGAEIFVVDRCSTDGAREAVIELAKKYPVVHLIEQNDDTGYGGSLRLGFQAALSGNFDPIITMNGDNSHDPVYIYDMLEHCQESGVIIASRYINGVRVESWQFKQLLLSKLANVIISFILVKPVWDFTSTFRCYRRDFLKEIDLERLQAPLYSVQLQLLYMAYKKRFNVKEIPFMFKDIHPRVSETREHSIWKTLRFALKYRAPLLEIFRHALFFTKDYQRFIDEYQQLVNPPKLRNNGNYEVKTRYSISVGVMAFNEEKLVGRCLEGLLNQQLIHGEIKEIIVISSGSTDRTDEIVREYVERDPRIRLIMQSRRIGKAAAINEFLDIAQGDIVVIESADTIAEKETIEMMVRPFLKKEIGMVGAHPVPVNDKNTLAGFCVHTLWDLHHKIALEKPKCGEMIAFRNIIKEIPNYTAVDEAAIESLIRSLGLELAYAPEAIVYNKGPENIKDFIKQRKRIAAGHRHLKATMGHQVATSSPFTIFKHLIELRNWKLKYIFYMMLLILIEAYSRFVGTMNFYLRDRNPFIWDISKSTKKM